MTEKMAGTRIVYIDHSGFLLETDSATIVFDYFRGAIPEIDQEKPLYILASHSHGDHFSEDVFALAEGVKEVHCLLADDIFPERVPEAYREATDFVAPYEIYDDDVLHVETLRSNDVGVAFLLAVPHKGETLRVYFAGDLNYWNWDGDAEDNLAVLAYRAELEKIKGQTFDIAFLPLDPRLEENAFGGIEEFLQYAIPELIVPIHMWGQYGIIDRLCDDPRSLNYRDRMLHIHTEGEEFTL